MDDLTTLCLLGVFVVIGFLLVSRLFGGRSGGQTQGDYAERGSERPEIDNPDVESRGGFGRDPRSGGSGSFSGGRRGGLWSGSGKRSGSGRADNPEVRSRGGFGRNKGS